MLTIRIANEHEKISKAWKHENQRSAREKLHIYNFFSAFIGNKKESNNFEYQHEYAYLL